MGFKNHLREQETIKVRIDNFNEASTAEEFQTMLQDGADNKFLTKLVK